MNGTGIGRYRLYVSSTVYQKISIDNNVGIRKR